MTQTSHHTSASRRDPRTFGGILYSSDFDTGHSKKRNSGGSPIAARIAADLRFDLQCQRTREFADRRKQEERNER